MRQLSGPQLIELRRAAGINDGFKPFNRWQREMIFRALVDRGLVDPVALSVTDAGRAAIEDGGAYDGPAKITEGPSK